MRVSVRELKNHLSRYLQQVTGGKQIIVTSHNTPLARLSPIPQSKDKDKEIQALLQIEGIRWNGKKPKGASHRPRLNGKNASDYVLEDRR